MRSIAFFRNLNQGQLGSPASAVLERAFVEAGAIDIRLFQSNGTVAFTSGDSDACVRDAVVAIHAASPWHDVAIVRPLAWIVDLVRDLGSEFVSEFSSDLVDHSAKDGKSTQSASARIELSLFDVMVEIPHETPTRGRRCSILRIGPGFAVFLNDRDRESNGTPTLERMLGTKVTSRGLPTLRRLVDREANPRE